MIRLFDAAVLATTKLRAHKIRTGITIGVSGILFGLLIAVVLVVQGVFESVEKFSEEGLNDRYVVSLSRIATSDFNPYDNRESPEFVAKVEAAHDALVAKKQTAAEKYGIDYDSEREDPTPIVVDDVTKQKVINDEFFDSQIIQEVARQEADERHTSFDPVQYLSSYSSVTVLAPQRNLFASDGYFSYMKDDQERSLTREQRLTASLGFRSGDDSKTLTLLPQTLADPFISVSDYEPESGELPVILPYSDVETLLKLEPLPSQASTEQKRDRIQEVRRRVGEVSVAFCYRNAASENLLARAVATADEIEKNRKNENYQEPSLRYTVPSDTSCGAVEVASDTRTEAERQLAENQKLYEQEIGTYLGEPEQQKVILRGVGVSADFGSAGTQWSVASMVQALFSSSLGYGVWNIPMGLLEQVPVSARPAAVFNEPSKQQLSVTGFGFESYLVEFGDKAEARELFQRTGYFASTGNPGSVSSAPFGSSSLVIDELKTWFYSIFLWVVLVVGIIAAIILSGLVGRTIADSRKETAVFRAIGATRGDITSVYTVYILLFSLRIVLFAFILGGALAGAAHILGYQDATLGAQLAFGVTDFTKQFNLVGFQGWYLPVITGAIIVVGFIAMVIPLLRNIRRSPINDMRDDS